MTDVTVADKDKFCGGRGKGLVPFRTFDAAFRARCVNRDLSHVLDDTDPNYRRGARATSAHCPAPPPL